MKDKKIVRPKIGRMFFGVAAAIANYIGIDPVIVRLIFVILTIWGGAGIILYIIGMIIIPEEGAQKERDNKVIEDRVKKVSDEVKKKFQTKRFRFGGEQFFGLILLIIGLAFILDFFFPIFRFWLLWPIGLIFFAIYLLFSGRKKDKEQ